MRDKSNYIPKHVLETKTQDHAGRANVSALQAARVCYTAARLRRVASYRRAEITYTVTRKHKRTRAHRTADACPPYASIWGEHSFTACIHTFDERNGKTIPSTRVLERITRAPTNKRDATRDARRARHSHINRTRRHQDGGEARTCCRELIETTCDSSSPHTQWNCFQLKHKRTRGSHNAHTTTYGE